MSSRRRSRSRTRKSGGSLDTLFGDSNGGNAVTCNNLTKHISGTAFWLYFGMALVLAIWSYSFYSKAHTEAFFNSLPHPAWAPTEHAFATINTAMFLFIGYSGYVSYTLTKSFKSHTSMMFVIVALLNVIYPWILLEKESPAVAFWALLLMFISVVWWMWMLQDVGARTGLGLMAAWLIYLLFWNYHAVTANGDSIWFL